MARTILLAIAGLALLFEEPVRAPRLRREEAGGPLRGERHLGVPDDAPGLGLAALVNAIALAGLGARRHALAMGLAGLVVGGASPALRLST